MLQNYLLLETCCYVFENILMQALRSVARRLGWAGWRQNRILAQRAFCGSTTTMTCMVMVHVGNLPAVVVSHVCRLRYHRTMAVGL
jgi:hypothetical protein